MASQLEAVTAHKVEVKVTARLIDQTESADVVTNEWIISAHKCLDCGGRPLEAAKKKSITLGDVLDGIVAAIKAGSKPATLNQQLVE